MADSSAKFMEEPNNVMEYRFVKDYPPISGVKSSQSGKPSHCSVRWRVKPHPGSGILRIPGVTTGPG
jgi:hypothetical protein